jgi:hypothetical protein
MDLLAQITEVLKPIIDAHGDKPWTNEELAHVGRIVQQIGARYELHHKLLGQTELGAALDDKAEFKKREPCEDGDAMLKVLDWLLKEHEAGRFPASPEIAKQFGWTIEQTEAMRVKLEEMGEL